MNISLFVSLIVLQIWCTSAQSQPENDLQLLSTTINSTDINDTLKNETVSIDIQTPGNLPNDHDNINEPTNELKENNENTDDQQPNNEEIIKNDKTSNSNSTDSMPYSSNTNETTDIKFSRFLKDNPDAIMITSPGYPNPYPDNCNQTWSLDVDGGTGIDVTIHDLDINPLTDFLYFSGGSDESEDQMVYKLSGQRTSPINFQILNTTKLFVWFYTDYNLDEEQRGFALSYAPLGKSETNETIALQNNESTPITAEDLQTIEILIVVPKKHQSINTWHRFKELLTNASNVFIEQNELPLEMASPENVTMVIKRCSPNWPDSENCLKIRFAICLWTKDPKTNEIVFNNSTTYEISTDHLWKMWNDFGRDEFTKHGFPEFKLPDTTFVILLWTGITVAITFLFLFILYSIWRMDIFQEYRRMSSGHEDQRNILKNQSDIDISMFPSPHQIVPTLFPNNEGYTTTSTTIPGEHSGTSYRRTSFTTNSLVDLSPKVIEMTEQKHRQNQFFPDDEITFSSIPSSTSSPRYNTLTMI